MSNSNSAPASAAAPLVISRTYGAPAHVVFAAWTDPEQMKQWFHPDAGWINPSIDVDLRVGGRYRVEFKHLETEQHEAVAGKFLEVEANRRLVYTWTWEPPNEFAGKETHVTVDFEEDDGDTTITISHNQFPADEMRSEHGDGWSGALDCLAELLRS